MLRNQVSHNHYLVGPRGTVKKGDVKKLELVGTTELRSVDNNGEMTVLASGSDAEHWYEILQKEWTGHSFREYEEEDVLPRSWTKEEEAVLLSTLKEIQGFKAERDGVTVDEEEPHNVEEAVEKLRALVKSCYETTEKEDTEEAQVIPVPTEHYDIFECSRCDSQFYTRSKCVLHIAQEHSDGKKELRVAYLAKNELPTRGNDELLRGVIVADFESSQLDTPATSVTRGTE